MTKHHYFLLLLFLTLAVLTSQTHATSEAPTLIRTVKLSATNICLGENVWVAARAVHPTSQKERVQVSINGLPGSTRRIVFNREPGKHRVVVNARSADGLTDTHTSLVTVADCEQVVAVVNTSRNPYRSGEVEFSVANIRELQAQAGRAPLTFEWNLYSTLPLTSTDPGASGKSFVTVDFTDHLDPDKPFTRFETSLTVSNGSGDSIKTFHDVVVYNDYFIKKERGLIEPPVEIDEVMESADCVLSSCVERQIANYTVRNLEDEKIDITSTYKETHFCKDSLSPTIVSVAPLFKEIEANESVSGTVQHIKTAVVSADVCGFSWHLSGTTASGKAVSFVLFTETKDAFEKLSVTVNNAAAASVLQLIEERLTGTTFELSAEDLHQLEREGHLPKGTQTFLSTAINGGVTKGATSDFDFEQHIKNNESEWEAALPGIVNRIDATRAAQQARAAGQLNEGELCEPGDTPPELGLACLPTDEIMYLSSYVANAKKGDVIVGTGCTVIGNLLRQVSPAQRYSHVGIMTDDYFEITHNTASLDRFEQFVTGGLNPHIEEDAMRYAWPGSITQSVEDAFEGAMLTDPETGEQYHIDDFDSESVWCYPDEPVLPQLVMKPHPEDEAAVRPLLHNAADNALNTKVHYRFGAYSDAEAMWNDIAPASAGWAAGSRGAVCTSFVRGALLDAGATLEGSTLESADTSTGAEVDASTADGLYLYNVAERNSAGVWLYGFMHDFVADNTGILASIADAPDNIASQLTNCFASDFCDKDARNSDAWDTSTGLGRAVSPDDMLWYDGSDEGGVFGRTEELIYMQGRSRAVYRWQPSNETRDVTVTIMMDGVPVQGASIDLDGINQIGSTNSSGEMTLQDVPVGSHEFRAYKYDDGFFADKIVTRDVESTTSNITLILLGQNPALREIVVHGTVDFYNNRFGASDQNPGPVTFYETVDINANHDPDKEVNIKKCMEFDGDVDNNLGVEIDLTLTVNSTTYAVTAVGEATFYNRNSPSNNSCYSQEKDDKNINRTATADGSTSTTFTLDHDWNPGGVDSAEIELIIENEVQP